jgi:hypothetical protein
LKEHLIADPNMKWDDIKKALLSKCGVSSEAAAASALSKLQDLKMLKTATIETYIDHFDPLRSKAKISEQKKLIILWNHSSVISAVKFMSHSPTHPMKTRIAWKKHHEVARDIYNKNFKQFRKRQSSASSSSSSSYGSKRRVKHCDNHPDSTSHYTSECKAGNK